MRIPNRTARGRDVLLDRTIDLDSKLRTVLAQCDGKRDEDQIVARFGAIVDVPQAITQLLNLGLIELPQAAPVAVAVPAAEIAAPVSVSPVVPPQVAIAEALAPVEPAATPASTPVISSEDDPFAEWFPASMRQPARERAA